jgi:colicin import membrane protein
MAQPSKATPDAVRAAISHLVSRGERVTLQTVRDEIGGGSLGTIQPILKAWRGDQDQAARDQATQAAPMDKEAPAVPVRVSQALDAGRQALETVAGAVVEAINAAVTDERRRGRLELETEREGWERRLAEAQDAQRAAEDETTQVAADAAGIERDRDDLAERLATTDTERDRLAGELTTERQAHQAAQALAGQRAAEIDALRQTVAQADARALAAEKAQAQAQEGQHAAEDRARAADNARQAADNERRQVIDQAHAQQERDAQRIDGLTAERDKLRQDLAAEKAAAEAAHRELMERIKSAEASTIAQTEKAETAQRQAAEASAAAEGAKAKAEQLAERLAGETARAADLAKRLDDSAAEPAPRSRGAKPKGGTAQDEPATKPTE